MKSTLTWILRKVKRRIPALVLMLISYVGSALLGVAFALGSSQVIDTAVSGNKDAFVNACILQGGIILGILVCLTVYRHLKDRMMAELDRDWKKDILHKLMHGDYSSVSAFHSAELINRLNNDVRIVDDGIITLLPNVAGMVTRMVAAMGVLIALEPMFAGVIIFLGIIVIVVTGVMRKQLKELNKRVSEQEGKVSGFLQETLEKLLLVQAMDISDEMERRADICMEERFQIQRKRKNVTLVANTGISIMTYATSFIALVWCAFGLLEGRITFGTLTAVTQLVGQLRGPLVNMSGIMPKYAAMTASAERLHELEEIQGEAVPVVDDAQVEVLYEKMKAIVAKDVCFSYDREEILVDASIVVPKGKFTVITGPSGIGKSTLLKVMLGIFKQDGGEMFLACEKEKVPINRGTRKLFAYVPQGNLLFSGTLRDNLVVAKPDAVEEEIKEAVFVSAMDEFLDQMPEGLDTVLGENAAGLSEGQAQRLAIARAILGGAPILLLDEATSALDANTEQTVLERIRGLSNRTCIVVTHRPAAMEVCDYNIQIEDKKIKVEHYG